MELNENDMRLLKSHLDNQEKVKAFLTAYMYILNVGNGDGITESVQDEMTSLAKDYFNHKKTNSPIMTLSLVEKFLNA